jgi:mannose-6-phosphate isomerase-like protein (cupin superfamily)
VIKQITHGDTILAILITKDHQNKGIEFFTPDDFSQQIALMSHQKGKIIGAHVHNPVKREVSFTKEVLIVKSGKVRVDFYDDNQNYLNKSIIIQEGDVILLAYGGHGFEVLEDCEMIEVKQGPYVGEQDKTRFNGIDSSKANIIEIAKL